MKTLSNDTLLSSLALEEELSRIGKRPHREQTEHLADARRKFRNVMSKTVGERFWAKVIKTDSCWIWTAKREKNGYGRFAIRDREFSAHRVAFTISGGTIPDGMTLDHLCKNTRCVNPAHLEPVTMKVNLLRGDTFQAKNSKKTHCPKGHPFTENNTYKRRDGSRGCRECIREAKRKFRSKTR